MKKIIYLLFFLTGLLSITSCGEGIQDPDDLTNKLGWIEYNGKRHEIRSFVNIYYSEKYNPYVEMMEIELITTEGNFLYILLTGGGNIDLCNYSFNYMTENPTPSGSFAIWLVDRENNSIIEHTEGKRGWLRTEGWERELSISADFPVPDLQGEHPYLYGGYANMRIYLDY